MSEILACCESKIGIAEFAGTNSVKLFFTIIYRVVGITKQQFDSRFEVLKEFTLQNYQKINVPTVMRFEIVAAL